MADLKSSDYYENLGVPRTATEQEIKSAYVAPCPFAMRAGVSC